jgi:hypothetical protein
LKKNDGKDFENIIGHLEKTMRPMGAVVTVDEKIETKYGPRQFDVTVRLAFGGVERIILIEAKDWKTKPKVDTVEGFIQRCRLVDNSQGIMVSREGFSKQSIRQAQDYGVVLKRIATTDDIAWAREIRLPFHVEEHRITGVTVDIRGSDGVALPEKVDVPEMLKAQINQSIDKILQEKHSVEAYVAGGFADSKGQFSITNGTQKIDLELFYKFEVSRNVFAGFRPAMNVLGYENLNEGRFELARWGQRIDVQSTDGLENFGDINIDTIGEEYGMGISVIQIDDFTPVLVFYTDR